MLAILVPDQGEEESKAAIDTLQGYITSGNGTIDSLQTDSPWGRRRLAYTIRHEGVDYRDGHYVLMYFTVLPSAIAEIERDLKHDTNVIRYLLLINDPEMGEKIDEAALAAEQAEAEAAAAEEASTAETEEQAEATEVTATEEAAPAEEAAPTEEAAPAEEAAPTEEAAPAEETANEKAPQEEATEEVASTEDEAPAEEVAAEEAPAEEEAESEESEESDKA